MTATENGYADLPQDVVREPDEKPVRRRRFGHPTTTQKIASLVLAVVAIFAAVVLVRRAVAANSSSYSGAVTTRGISNLNFAGSGRIATATVHLGQRVHRGDVLATQDSTGLAGDIGADQRMIAADNASIAALRVTVPPRPAQLAERSAALASHEAQLTRDRADLAATRIVAPADGVIIAVNGHPGETADPDGLHQYGALDPVGQQSNDSPFALLPKGPQPTVTGGQSGLLPVISLRTSDAWQVTAAVPEKSIHKIGVGTKVSVHIAAGHVPDARGSVTEVLPTSTTTSQGVYYQVLIAIDKTSGQPPLPGMTADVTVSG